MVLTAWRRRFDERDDNDDGRGFVGVNDETDDACAMEQMDME